MLHIFKKTEFYILIFCALSATRSQTQVGDSCNLPIRGKGVCKNVADCPKASTQASVGIPPKLCSKRNNVIIVCCQGKPGATATITTTTQPTPRIIPLQNNLRKSQQKCYEYSQPTHYTEFAVPLSPLSGLVRSQVESCQYSGQALIFGGTEAILGEFPHMALLGFGPTPNWGCGGSLISDKFVLTAAHCIVHRNFGNLSTVRLGELNIAETESGSEPQDFPVEDFFPHPNYSRKFVYNDIALVKLARRVQFDSYKRPACLWTEFELEQNTTIASGWGTTENDSNSFNNALLKTGLDVIQNDKCQIEFHNSFDKRLSAITNNVLCAINTTSLGDTCAGDSGGPIQIVEPEYRCIYYVIGVTAAGRGCGGRLPSIYTRVSEYIDWIEGIVWP